jgi:hypothetical protein
MAQRVELTPFGLPIQKKTFVGKTKVEIIVADYKFVVNPITGQLDRVVNNINVLNGRLRGGRVVEVTRVTNDTVIDDSYHHVFGNTDTQAITITLPAGDEGREYRIINTGSSENNLILTPDGTENLIGVNSSFTLTDGEALILIYNSIDGWY